MDLSWEGFLRLLSTPNVIAAIVGILASFAAEYIPGFDALAPKWKRVAFFLLSFVVPVGGALLGVLTLDWPMTWEPTFWPAFVAGWVAFAGGTIAHTRKL